MKKSYLGRYVAVNLTNQFTVELRIFRVPKHTTAVMGHTRNATQGTLKFNENNHPFRGKCGHTNFALAHNGILSNDRTLRRQLKLPKTKIETDSYIAVQLVENKKRFDMESIKYMAENVEGSFSFSLLDDMNNLYLVKGDSPLTIFHFPSKSFMHLHFQSSGKRSLIPSCFTSFRGENMKRSR